MQARTANDIQSSFFLTERKTREREKVGSRLSSKLNKHNLSGKKVNYKEVSKREKKYLRGLRLSSLYTNKCSFEHEQ